MLSYILFCVYVWMQYPGNLLNNMTCEATAKRVSYGKLRYIRTNNSEIIFVSSDLTGDSSFCFVSSFEPSPFACSWFIDIWWFSAGNSSSGVTSFSSPLPCRSNEFSLSVGSGTHGFTINSKRDSSKNVYLMPGILRTRSSNPKTMFCDKADSKFHVDCFAHLLTLRLLLPG